MPAQGLDHLVGRDVGRLGRRIPPRCRPRHRSGSAGSSDARGFPWDRPRAAAAGGCACFTRSNSTSRSARSQTVMRLGAHQRPRLGVHVGAAAGRQDVRRARPAGGRSPGARRRGTRPRRSARRTRRSSSRPRARSRRRRRRTAGRAAAPAACRWRSCRRPSGRRGPRCAAAIEEERASMADLQALDVAHSAAGFKRAAELQRLPPRIAWHCRSGGGRVVCPPRAPVPFQNPVSVPSARDWAGDLPGRRLPAGLRGSWRSRVFEPRPPVKHFEVPVPNERFSR